MIRHVIVRNTLNWNRERLGFSLIEVLAALMLASLLMMAVLQLLRNLHVKERLVAQSLQVHAPWHDRLFGTLERDLRNSRRCSISAGQIDLEGHCGTSGDQAAADLSDAVVTWKIIPTERSSILVRFERPARVTQSVRETVMAIGLQDMSFWYPEAPDVSYHETSASPTALGGDEAKWMPTPAAVICQFDAGDTNPTTVRRTMLINGRSAQ